MIKTRMRTVINAVVNKNHYQYNDPMDTSKPTAGQTDRPERPPSPSRVIDARTLFNQANVVLIEYKGATYQLRQTRNGKLILTK